MLLSRTKEKENTHLLRIYIRHRPRVGQWYLIWLGWKKEHIAVGLNYVSRAGGNQWQGWDQRLHLKLKEFDTIVKWRLSHFNSFCFPTSFSGKTQEDS